MQDITKNLHDTNVMKDTKRVTYREKFTKKELTENSPNKKLQVSEP